MIPPNAIEDVTQDLRARFEALRVAYERFMLGMDRTEPAAARVKFVKDLRRVLARPPNNTAQNFRLQAIKTRLFTYEALWDRELAAREASSPRRVGIASVLGARQQPALPPEAVLPAPIQPRLNLQQLYADFLAAYADGPAGKPPAFAAFELLVAKQMQSIKERTGWQDVGLRVTRSQGRPALQAFNASAKSAPAPAPAPDAAPPSNKR